jgi:site-specific recombinase XerD
MLLADAIEGYWLANERNFSPNTVNDYRLTFRRLANHCTAAGIDAFEGITPDHINALLNELARAGLAKKTLLNVWIALSSLWTWAEHTVGARHIIRQVARPRPQRVQPQPYEADEIRRLLDAADYSAPWASQRGRNTRTRRATGQRDRAMMLVLLDTGMRASEICALRIADYDRRSGKLIIQHGKGDRTRVVYVGQATRQAIWRYIQDRLRRRDKEQTLRGSEPLFATNSGQALDRSQLLHMLRGCGQRAGVAAVNVHRFRHTCAVTMLRNGANALVVQEMLGHVDMTTVRLYVKLAEVDLEQAMRLASPVDTWRL